MVNEGFIKLRRKVMEWEWYTEPNTMRLFIHLLLRVNFRDGRWQGRVVRAGQTITGRKRLSVETGMSEQNIRTALRNLQSTNEITVESTSQFSVITIVKYAEYQGAQMAREPGQGLPEASPSAPANSSSDAQGEEHSRLSVAKCTADRDADHPHNCSDGLLCGSRNRFDNQGNTPDGQQSDLSDNHQEGLALNRSDDQPMTSSPPELHQLSTTREKDKNKQEGGRSPVSEDRVEEAVRLWCEMAARVNGGQGRGCRGQGRQGQDLPDQGGKGHARGRGRRLPVPLEVTGARRAAIRARLEEPGGLSGWADLLERVERSSFLNGSKGGFRATIDFVAKRSNALKIREGAYDDTTVAEIRDATPQAMDDAFHRVARDIAEGRGL